ncbi:MAG: hypothetical protein EOO24_11955 [Comamonadaceae bacterium]|nr:MAG: hypothetical protein EOO24_11955 [Comamonadaceae bacterium]
MRLPGPIHLAVLLATAALAACGDAGPSATTGASPTAVLGGVGGAPRATASAPLTDSAGRVIPAPPLPRGAKAEMARSGPDTAIAVWVERDHVVAASYAPASGWAAATPLEEIFGEASRPQVAGNGRGAALAVWQHTVGNIQSLRFSRFDATTGWTPPDVMPGALPRPPEQARGPDAAPQLHMDAQGNAFAQWPSGFAANEVQTARYVLGQGWTRALSEPLTATAPPGPGQPSSAVQ